MIGIHFLWFCFCFAPREGSVTRSGAGICNLFFRVLRFESCELNPFNFLGITSHSYDNLTHREERVCLRYCFVF